MDGSLFPDLPMATPPGVQPKPSRQARIKPQVIWLTPDPLTLQRTQALERIRLSKVDRAFITGMAKQGRAREPLMSERQIQQITRMAHKYRGQLPPEIIPF